MFWFNSRNSAAAGSYPGTGDSPYDDKYPDREDGIEPPGDLLARTGGPMGRRRARSQRWSVPLCAEVKIDRPSE